MSFSTLTKNQMENMRGVVNFAKNNPWSSLYGDLPEIQNQHFEEVFSSIRPIDISKLCEYERELSHFPEEEVYFVPSSLNINSEENFCLIPKKIDDTWNSLDEKLKKVRPNAAILLVPPDWNIGPLFYKTCRENSAPASLLPPRNPKLVAEVIRETNIDMIVTTPSAAGELEELLIKSDIYKQIKHWHIISSVENTDMDFAGLSKKMMIEYHLFPGVPVAFALKDDGGTIQGLIPFNEYLFEINEEGKCFITSMIELALPLIRFEIGGNWDIEIVGGFSLIKPLK
jgi:hypothetical protein